MLKSRILKNEDETALFMTLSAYAFGAALASDVEFFDAEQQDCARRTLAQN
jgi:hypothetical protein